ncbi:MAG: hypothetical protein KGM17_03860 [Sphingomonadales bacterium]|nr:hypothetical protein [Sphingomonadales bacterium]
MAEDDQTAMATQAQLPPAAPRRSGGLGRLLAGTALGLAVGVGLAGWWAWHSGVDIERLLAGRGATGAAVPGEASAVPNTAGPALDTVEGRVARLESRLGLLDQQARDAAGNAGRAEALLIAFATRRAIERGAPLGYLEDQLKLRFGDALPNAVGTVLAAARNPVTLDQLALGLDELAAQAAGSPQENGWARVRRQISGLFVIHNAPEAAASDPGQRLAQVRLMLREGRTGEAIAAVRALPLPRREEWVAAAVRYQDAERALDLLETTALVEPRELVDRAGRKVPVPAPVPAPAPARPSAPPT